MKNFAVILFLVSACRSVPSGPAAEEAAYLRVVENGTRPECTFTIRPEAEGWSVDSVTTRGSTRMTVSARYGKGGRLLSAEAVLAKGRTRQAVRARVADGKATVSSQASDDKVFDVGPGVIVTSAPDWGDTFFLCRRYDRAKGGRQEFQALWIHPVQASRVLMLSIEKTDGEGADPDRFDIRLRGGSRYVAWADSTGRMIKLVSLPFKKGSTRLVRRGYEDAAKALVP